MSTQKNFMMSEVISYTPPKLYTGKTGKDWYIGFYAFDPISGSLKLKRIKINHINKISDRRKYASDLILRLHEQLRRGWNPYISDDNVKGLSLFEEATDKYRTYITRLRSDNVIREETYIGYISYLRNLIRYNQMRKVPITYVYQFNRSYINEFIDHIYIERENSAQTRNNYLAFLRIFSSWCFKQGYIDKVVTDGIDFLPKRSLKKQRTVITEPDLVRLREYCENHNKRFLLACYILFYCFVRPKEISYIKIGDFHVKEGTLLLHGDYTKNKKDAVLTINRKIIDLMLDCGSFSYPSDFYLFSDHLSPGDSWHSEKQFRDYWTHYVRKSLKFPNSYKFYSLKDTGVTTMLRSRIDNISVRDQARHSSILITDIYTPHDIEKANPIIKNFDTAF